jgi:hypothetical protein
LVVLLFEDFGGAIDKVDVIFQDVVESTAVRDIGLDAQILDERANAGATANGNGERSVAGQRPERRIRSG